MAASKDAMGRLHAKLAALMLEELEWYNDPKQNTDKIPMPAADKSAISKFLKDNDITCDPMEDGNLAELRRQFEAKPRSGVSDILKKADDDLEAMYPGHTH